MSLAEIASKQSIETKQSIQTKESIETKQEIEAVIAVTTETIGAKKVPHRVYKYRFVILLLYSLVTIGNQILWSACVPITTNLQEIYGVDQLVVNLSASLGMLIYLPVAIPSNYILDTWGIKKGLMIGAALTIIGVWVRLLAGVSFYFVILGTIISALGTPLLFNCPQKISAYWVAPEKRTQFTTILTLPSSIGMAIGFYMPSAIVGTDSSAKIGKEDFLKLILIEAVVITAVSIPIFFFFKERPPTPPSTSAELPREDFKRGVKDLFKNKNFLWLVLSGGMSLGILNCLATVIESFVLPFGFSQYDTSNLGIIYIMLGLAGCVALGAFVGKTKKYKMTIIVANAAALLTLGMFIGLLYTRNIVGVSIAVGLMGFFMTSTLPLSLEFAAEITFPIGEATSGGLLIGLSQIISAAQIFIVDGIMSIKDQKLGAVYSLIMLLGMMVIALVASILVGENLKRSKVDHIIGSKSPDELERKSSDAAQEIVEAVVVVAYPTSTVVPVLNV